MLARAGVTTRAWIEPTGDSNEERLALTETACAGVPEFCTWQQVRLPAEEGTGQVGPQHGALIAVSACAVAQPKPAYSASASTSSATIPFFTKSKLTLWGDAGNSSVRTNLDHGHSGEIGAVVCCRSGATVTLAGHRVHLLSFRSMVLEPFCAVEAGRCCRPSEKMEKIGPRSTSWIRRYIPVVG